MSLIVSLVLLAAQASTPEVHREHFTFQGSAYPAELQEQVSEYQACLMGDEKRAYYPDESARNLHEADISRCDPMKAELIEMATAILSGEREPEAAREVAEQVFEAQEQDHRAQAEQLDMLNQLPPQAGAAQ